MFNHRKLLLVCVLGIVAIFAYRSFTGTTPAQTISQEQVIPAYQQSAPETVYVFQTTSRLYYVNVFTQDEDGRYTLTDYYIYDADKWVKGVQPLPLGDIKVNPVKR